MPNISLARPVANAEVKYYIYRSRYYAWNFGEDDSEETERRFADTGRRILAVLLRGGDDMVQESEGTLDARGHLNVDFQIPQRTRTTRTTTVTVWKRR